MTNYPNGFDDDSTLPPVNDNIDQIGADAINALRDAVVAIEMTLGTNIAGVQPTLADRLGVFINQDGTPNTSIIYSLGLVTLPITDSMIAPAAGIEESKLMLDYPTQDLFNYIRDLSKDVNLAIGWISVSGVKLEPHLIGALYRHDLAQIDVAEVSTQFLNNVFRVLRDNTDAYTLINDMNNELLAHQWADGSPFGTIQDITTNDGSTYPSNYAHVASGIFLDTTGFSVIPQTAINDQLAWDFIDQNSLFLLGTRIQNLYANGISVNSQSSSLTTDGYGQPLVPPTPAIAYLRSPSGSASSPIDGIGIGGQQPGDDLIQFLPTTDDGYVFDSQFALVRIGDIVRVNYAADGYNVEVAYVISEKRYIPANGNTPASFFVRIAGKNIAYSPNAIARIDKTLFNNNKQGVLAIAGVNSPSGNTPSLIVANPRGAQCIGVGFSPDEFNETHYFLYLALYPDGNPMDGYTILPAIDVTGNGGTTPGSYTLDGIVNATNLAFRQPGFNYRFIAFQHEGQFGIMLADSYNNASFSVINGTVTQTGFYSQALSELNFPNNVIDLFPSAQTVTTGSTITLPVSTLNVASTAGFDSSGTLSITTTSNGVQAITYTSIVGNTFQGVSGGTGSVPAGSPVTEVILGINAPDPLGFGPYGAGVSSPVFMNLYGSYAAAAVPTVVFPPLRRNNFYVNGTEQEKLLDYENDGQVEDQYGDGYWVASVYAVPSAGPNNQPVQYLVPLNLQTSGLKVGKTLVVQPLDGYNFGIVDYGRFIISDVTFPCNCSNPTETLITVYDAVHGVGGSPYPVLPVGSPVAIYFNNDSVSFNAETATDSTVLTLPFKRHFEVYVDGSGDTFTHERARFLPTGGSGTSIAVNGVFGSVLYQNSNFATMDIISISPTLRGYEFGNVNKINLNITSFSSSTGEYTGYLNSFDGTNFLSQGSMSTGRIGEVTRFYDQSHSDYIDVVFEFTIPAPSFTNQYIDIQLFPSLALDQDNMLLGTVQVNNSNNTVGAFQDLRQFGNTSEQQLTTSALDYIALPEQLLHFNGIIRGFGFLNNDGGPTPPDQYGSAGIMALNGGMALVNGNINTVNPEIFLIPALQEQYVSVNYPINYALCVNSDGDLVTIVLSDYDPVLGTPNAPERIVTVVNVVSSTIYNVDSSTFSNLLNNRKDLLPLYIVSAVVTGAGLTAATTLSNIRDVRRYAKDSDSEIPAVLTSDNSQGNFKTIDAALNWLKFNAEFQNFLQIKGSFTEAVDPGLNFPLTVEAGGSTASLTFNAAMNMADVTFDGMTVTFSSTWTASNCTFNNCTVTVIGTSNLTNVTFTDCTVTFDSASTWTNVVIDPSVFNINATMVIAGVLAKDSTFNVSVTQGFTISSGVDFGNSIFNYTANPVGIGAYSTSDLVNASSGMFYAPVGVSLSGINIIGCTFNNTLPDHFPFICFNLTNYYAILQGVNISNNTFTSQATTNDIRAVIAFVGTQTTAAGPKFPEASALAHVTVENNICNYDQTIIISCYRVGGVISNNPCSLLTTTNVRIIGNTCGAIGFITATSWVSDNDDSVAVIGSGAGFVRNKKMQLVIERNACKFIGNLDATGTYIPFLLNTNGVGAYPTSSNAVQYVQDYTGAVSISGNTASWIQVGYYGTESGAWAEPVTITGNRLSPTNSAYLNNFYDANSTIAPTNVAILVRRALDSSASAGQALVSGNTISQGTVIQTGGDGVVYYYDAAIVTYNHANVLANQVVGGVVNNGPLIWIWGDNNVPANGPVVNCQQNMLDRGGLTITAYVYPAQVTCSNNVTITNNVFDSMFLDTNNTVWNDLIPNPMPSAWTYDHNKNQISYVAKPLYSYFSGGGWPQGEIPNGYENFIGAPAEGGEVFGSLQTSWQTDGESGEFSLQMSIPLSDIVPAGCKIMYAVLGMYNEVNQLGNLVPGATGAAAILQAFQNQSNQVPTPVAPSAPACTIASSGLIDFPALANTLADIGNVFSSVTYTFSPNSGIIKLDGTGQGVANVNTIQVATIFMLLDFTQATYPFFTGRENDPTIGFNLNQVAWGDGPADIDFAPLIIRYAWA
jgi:hypothetical protein